MQLGPKLGTPNLSTPGLTLNPLLNGGTTAATRRLRLAFNLGRSTALKRLIEQSVPRLWGPRLP